MIRFFFSRFSRISPKAAHAVSFQVALESFRGQRVNTKVDPKSYSQIGIKYDEYAALALRFLVDA